MKRLLITAMTAVMAVLANGAITGKIVTENDSKTGTIKWNTRAKAYVVSQKAGGAMIDVEVPLTDVVSLEIVKPEGLDKAIQQVTHKQAGGAIATLAKITKEYAHLQWDVTAGRYLAEAYLQLNQPEKALDTCKSVIDADKTTAWKGELAPAYWNALLTLNKRTELDNVLQKAAASGDRYSSGAALTMRGDIVMKDGNESADAAKKALIDGYLRVVLMYTDQPVATQLRPEALYKAANCFEKLGQSGRADAFRGELKRLYAASQWASK